MYTWWTCWWSTWEELLGGCRDLGLLGDTVSMVRAAGAARRTEARDFLHALWQRGNLQSPQHVHWVWGGHTTASSQASVLYFTDNFTLCVCTPYMSNKSKVESVLLLLPDFFFLHKLPFVCLNPQLLSCKIKWLTNELSPLFVFLVVQEEHKIQCNMKRWYFNLTNAGGSQLMLLLSLKGHTKMGTVSAMLLQSDTVQTILGKPGYLVSGHWIIVYGKKKKTSHKLSQRNTPMVN